MWQRIQSIYLAFIVLLSSILWLLPMASKADVPFEAGFEGSLASATLALSLLLIVALALFTFLGFRKRKRQMQLALALAGSAMLPYLILGWWAWQETKSTFGEIAWSVSVALPAVCALLALLARNAVAADERLVRAADRLR